MNINKLITYLNKDKSAYHAVNHCEEVLKDNGFTELSMKEKFTPDADGKYYVKPYKTSLFAFVMPEDLKDMRIAMAHTDFPTFKVKPVAMLNSKAGCSLINVEPYGGSLKKTWFDRPLAVAGLVVVKTDNAFEPKELLYDSEDAIVTIPSLAPHMDRDIEKKDIDPAKEMNPVISLISGQSDINELIANKLNVNKDDILSYDLNLYDVTEAMLIGSDKEFLQAGKLDNMASCAALTEAIVKCEKSKASLNMIALFDNEEVGSRTKQGADSDILKWIITKICYDLAGMANESEIISILYNSMLLSCDGAHAVHPNYPEKADTTSIAELGKGIVIKTSASQRYVTDAKAIAIIKAICDKNDIKYQLQANKSGTPGGQTLGPIASSYIPATAIDMGVPMLAMHSVREMISVQDYMEFEKLITKVFSE